MKTIAELETELADLEAHEKQLWERVQEQQRVLETFTQPWCEVNNRLRKLIAMIEARKDMEVTQ